MHSTDDVGAAIAAAARTIDETRSLDETLNSIAQGAAGTVPGITDVGISTLDRGGAVSTRAATSDLVWTLDTLQYSLGEGPCVDSLRHVSVLVVPHLKREQRWPRFVPEAVKAGLKAQMAVRLYVDEEGTVGGLNLYSTATEEIEAGAESLADLFATHAAIALGHARKRENLHVALHSRKVIGQAIGIVMERYRIGEDAAFGFLVRASRSGNVKLRDVAQALVDEGNRLPRP
jgi:GAF domain-containing protein